MRPSFVWLLIGLVWFTAVARADEDVVIPAGGRVRVIGPDARARIGTLIALDDSTLTLKEESHDVMRTNSPAPSGPIRRAEIARLDVSIKPGNRAQHALVGIGIGAALGAVMASGKSDDIVEITPAGGAILGAIPGLLLGLLTSHGEQWKTVEPDRVRLSLRQVPGGAVQVCVVGRW